MTAYLRHGSWLAVLAALAGASAGCNPFLLPFLLGPEPRKGPDLHKLAADTNAKEVRVLILTHTPQFETRSELLRADAELTARVAEQLNELFKFNEENVTIVNPRKVEEYKNANPRWYEDELRDLGKRFKVDYVVYVEMHSLGLFEPKSHNMMLRGRAQLTVNLAEVNKADSYPKAKELTLTYPSEAKGPTPAEDTNVREFRQKFLTHVARQVAWCFSARASADEYKQD